MLKILLFIFVGTALTVVALRLFSRSGNQAPAVGSPAPKFSLPSQHGDIVSLQAFRGAWVVLYFYPKDLTTGCTREAHNFQLDLPKFAARHAVILGVSVDSVASHKNFCAKEGLDFKLLSDTSGAVSKAYGSLTNLGIVKFSARHTFVIDPAGQIAKTYFSVNPARHSDEVLADLDRLQAESRSLP